MNCGRETLSKSLGAAVLVIACAVLVSGCAPQGLQPRTIPIAKFARTHDLPGAVIAHPDPLPALDPSAEPTAPGEETEPAEVEPSEAEPAEGPLTGSPLDDLAEVEVEAEVGTGELAKSRDLLTQGPTFDIPVPVNDSVLTWVELYSHRFKGAFEAGLARSGRYMERFREIFAEEGVPQDLVYMAAVESGYKTSAYSRAHARGIFQFIAPTARLYGLRVDSSIDERADPEKSCRAAAQYMKKLYRDFGDWHLALAAYNAGEGKVEQAIQRSGSTDFWSIAQTQHLKRETRNHVPAVLAAALLSKEPEKYGLTYAPEPRLRYDTVTVDDAVDLRVVARCSDVDYETLRELNPALRSDHTPFNTRVQIHLPEGRGKATLAALSAMPRQQRMPEARYRVRSGDTLSLIAGRHGVSVGSLQAANGLGNHTMIQAGQSLRIPGVSGSRSSVSPERKREAKVLVHQVKGGDTLSEVAQRYRTTTEAVAAASGVPAGTVLSVGDRLTVVPGVKSASVARRIAGSESRKRAEPAEARIHTVRAGETLWTIASRYRTSVNMLCSINSISPTGVLRPGAALTVGFE